MKKEDLFFAAIVAIIVLPFCLIPEVYETYKVVNSAHGYLLAFAKFGILATLGEMFILRIRTGAYSYPNFGLVPRSIIWGIFGVWIAIAMKTFAIGAPAMVETLGVDGVTAAMKSGEFTFERLLGAFSISVMMNTAYGPVFMTMHKVTDAHLAEHKGALSSLWSPIAMRRLLSGLDWDTQWNFVFKRTIPLFWIPAHTVTFMLPSDMQVLFAAVLSIALGVLLTVSKITPKK